jgi:hypothetical protein
MIAQQQQTTKSSQVDWLLQSLVSMVNDGSCSIPITLSVGGLLISGDLIGGKTYFDEFARQFKDGFFEISSKTASTLEESFRRLGDVYSVTEERDDEFNRQSPQLIHLRNAQTVYSAGSAVDTSCEPMLWRGRLAAVDGFSLGRISTTA